RDPGRMVEGGDRAQSRQARARQGPQRRRQHRRRDALQSVPHTHGEDTIMANDIVSYAPRNLVELDQFCQRICKSALVPKAYQNKPEDTMVAIMHGHDFGIPPLASLQFIAVINGRPAFYGDAVAGVALKSGAIVDVDETFEGTQGA